LLGYVGAPLVREALLVAKETFAEMRAENELCVNLGDDV
jgi:hypothetical protein